MNKREADIILLACKKHGISLTMRKEGNVYFVNFINRIEIRSFEGAKLITNGLVVECKFKKESKKHIVELETSTKLNFSNYNTRKNRSDNGVLHGLIERKRRQETTLREGPYMESSSSFAIKIR